MSEAEWQKKVLELARWYQWKLTYHPPDNRPGRSGHIQNVNPGFPDLILVKPPRMLAIELKSEKGIASPAQIQWLLGLEAAGVEVEVWRPSMESHVVDVLAGRAECPGLSARLGPKTRKRNGVNGAPH